jgi:hypothetical protein
MTPEQTVERAAQARQLLDNKLLAEALDAVEKEYIRRWRLSAYGDMISRESCYFLLASLEELKTQLRAWVEHGKIADIDLKAKGKR